MATIRRPGQRNNSLQLPLTIFIFFILFSLILYVAVVPGAGESPIPVSNDADANGNASLNKHSYKQAARVAEQRLRSTVSQKREQLAKALQDISISGMPGRLRILRERHEIVGERLAEIKAGSETVHEVLLSKNTPHQHEVDSDKPPMELKEIITYLTEWIHTLHETLSQDEVKHATYEGIWQAYHDLTVKTLYPWDREYLSRMPPRREDGSVFLSLATYRDENCLNTITWAYEKAKDPDKLFVGMVQQNCHADCMSGVLAGGGMEHVEPDQDCYQAFCDSPNGKKYCDAGQVRNIMVDEPESLGPYAARYFASKMWYGEQWFMQTDSHMTFKQDWDAISVKMLQAAPSKKPVLSHYPPSHLADLEKMADTAASRLCGPIFAASDLESQIIRLEGASVSRKRSEAECSWFVSVFVLCQSHIIYLSEHLFIEIRPQAFGHSSFCSFYRRRVLCRALGLFEGSAL
jgi:hypothetical protein